MTIDWQAVERDFRTGDFTLRELGAKHGCSHVAVSKRARKESWKADLRTAVRQATSAALIEEAVAGEVRSTAEVVLVQAEIRKAVVLAHRGDLKAASTVAMELLDELRQSRLTAEQKAALASLLAGDAPDDVARARGLVAKFTALPTRISSVKALAEALTKLQAAERVAFGLDEKEDERPQTPLAEALKGFMKSLHESGAGRAPIVPPAFDSLPT